MGPEGWFYGSPVQQKEQSETGRTEKQELTAGGQCKLTASEHRGWTNYGSGHNKWKLVNTEQKTRSRWTWCHGGRKHRPVV